MVWRWRRLPVTLCKGVQITNWGEAELCLCQEAGSGWLPKCSFPLKRNTRNCETHLIQQNGVDASRKCTGFLAGLGDSTLGTTRGMRISALMCADCTKILDFLFCTCHRNLGATILKITSIDKKESWRVFPRL